MTMLVFSFRTEDLTHLLIQAPRFSRDVYEVELYENSSIGTQVLTMTAYDVDADDNARITYGIAADNQPAQSWFTIDAQSGIITTRSPLDCNISTRPQITVTATDCGTPTMSATSSVRQGLFFLYVFAFRSSFQSVIHNIIIFH